MVATIIATGALVAIVSWAVWYIVTKKRTGVKCIGCPVANDCAISRMLVGSQGGKVPLTLGPTVTRKLALGPQSAMPVLAPKVVGDSVAGCAAKGVSQ